MRLLACAIVLCASSGQAFQAAPPDLAAQARSELYAGRNDYAATLYQKLADQEPTRGDAYYGLVRALLKAHKSHDAYTAAEQGLQKAPQTPGAQVAAGMLHSGTEIWQKRNNISEPRTKSILGIPEPWWAWLRSSPRFRKTRRRAS